MFSFRYTTKSPVPNRRGGSFGIHLYWRTFLLVETFKNRVLFIRGEERDGFDRFVIMIIINNNYWN